MKCDVIPIGIDPAAFKRTDDTRQDPGVANLAAAAKGRKIILSGGRIDPIKDQLGSMLDYRQLLEQNGDLRRTVFLAFIGAASRLEIGLNSKYERDTRQVFKGIQRDFPDAVGLLPGVAPWAMRPAFRMARVGLVGSKRDGFALVGPEHAASQDPENPGVTVISKHIGAASVMTGALQYDSFKTRRAGPCFDGGTGDAA